MAHRFIAERDRIIAHPINDNRAIRRAVVGYLCALAMGMIFLVGYLGRMA